MRKPYCLFHSGAGCHMLTGKRFSLERSTLALCIEEGKRRMITIPVGTVLKVVSEPTSYEHMVEVLWEGRVVTMFAVDVDVPDMEVKDESASA